MSSLVMERSALASTDGLSSEEVVEEEDAEVGLDSDGGVSLSEEL